MPKLIPTKKFLEDLERLKSDAAMRKKIAKSLSFLEVNPNHPGLHLERIVNDSQAWSIRVDRRYRISFEPEIFFLQGILIGQVLFCCYVFWTTMIYINILVEQCKEKKIKDPTIAEKFDTYRFFDYKEQVIDLFRRVCTVSIKTMEMVKCLI